MKILNYRIKDNIIRLETDEGRILLQIIAPNIIRCIYSIEKPSTQYSSIEISPSSSHDIFGKLRAKGI
jgi:hypothetical protein